jgi:hypothetical protein
MNHEQNNQGNASNPAEETSSINETNKTTGGDDYYSVDEPKKELNTSIGDGEMHNEGLVGDGGEGDDNVFTDGSTSEQDDAELHDSEG